MKIKVRAYEANDIPDMIKIWNEVVSDGIAFPQEEFLDLESGAEFFSAQSKVAVAVDADTDTVLGLYILHPNNIGRCGHIANTSYAVASQFRGHKVGEYLVKDSLRSAAELGFKILQFNAVVKSNTYARRLYEKLGFTQLGVIPKGFRMKDGHYEDICPYFIEL